MLRFWGTIPKCLFSTCFSVEASRAACRSGKRLLAAASPLTVTLPVSHQCSPFFSAAVMESPHSVSCCEVPLLGDRRGRSPHSMELRFLCQTVPGVAGSRSEGSQRRSAFYRLLLPKAVSIKQELMQQRGSVVAKEQTVVVGDTGGAVY